MPTQQFLIINHVIKIKTHNQLILIVYCIACGEGFLVPLQC